MPAVLEEDKVREPVDSGAGHHFRGGVQVAPLRVARPADCAAGKVRALAGNRSAVTGFAFQLQRRMPLMIEYLRSGSDDRVPRSGSGLARQVSSN
jgi:hypothetical protein